jgi:hypothetical protein
MWLAGWFLRLVTGVINERMTSDLAERELAKEQAAAAAVAQPARVAAAPAAPRRR